jgi:hypothetical protein
MKAGAVVSEEKMPWPATVRDLKRGGARSQYAGCSRPCCGGCCGIGAGHRRPSVARAFGWLWMDPLAGIIGACVIASWSFRLIRDTGAILLDMNPDRRMADNLKRSIKDDGGQLVDLHLWRLGPGHLGAIVSVATTKQQEEQYYRAKLARFRSLSHLTTEVRHIGVVSQDS